MEHKRLAALIVGGFLLAALLSVGSYALGNGQGYQSGHEAGYSQGHASGYQSGHEAGYSQGEANGYTSGYGQGEQAEYTLLGNELTSWIDQNCFDYPFLLLDTSKYMACHR